MSDPRKKRRHPKHKRPPLGSRPSGSGAPSYANRMSRVKPTNSFSRPTPSAAPVSLEAGKRPPAVCRSYIFGLAGVTLLILLGGGHNLFALSLSLLLPGIALILNPPKKSPGLWLDRMAIAFLAVLLLSFLPQFYWPDPDWRVAAEEVFQISLPHVLSIQPWAGFEAWIMALGGFAWFYVACSWKINNSGRTWFYFAICLVVGSLAALVLWGNMKGATYPAAGDSHNFSFFQDRNQTANFLVVGGLAAFGYAMCALRTRHMLPLLGLVVAPLAFLSLLWVNSRAGVILIFLAILVWYFVQLSAGRMSKLVRLGLPLLLISVSYFIVSKSQTTERALGLIASPEQRSEVSRGELAKDAIEMIKDAPVSGHGLGTFAAIFPQYREHSADHQPALHPKSDALWLAAEAGIPGFLLLGGFLFAYLRCCRGLNHGLSGDYRLVAFAALLIFLLHSIVDVAGHRPGTIYFAILFAALALPEPKQSRPAFNPKIWRVVGVFLVLIGLLWAVSGLTRLPLHSSVALATHQAEMKESIASADYEKAMYSANKWVSLRPFDWHAYFERATLTLSDSGAKGDAAADFLRARFVEPNLGVIAFEEGKAWIPYDAERALSAWREVFSREFDDREDYFEEMLDLAAANPALKDGLGRLSLLDSEFRFRFVTNQSGDDLMQEIRRDLEENARLGQYSRQQRTSIVKNWIKRGDKEAVKRFLEENSSGLNRPWWLWSLLRMEQAEFEDSLNYIRSNITAPEIPKIKLEGVPLVRLKREFSVAPGDIMKGRALLQIYIAEKDYQKVLNLTQAIIAAGKEVPGYVKYWNAESYFLLNDYIDSWYAFEEYLEDLWEEE